MLRGALHKSTKTIQKNQSNPSKQSTSASCTCICASVCLSLSVCLPMSVSAIIYVAHSQPVTSPKLFLAMSLFPTTSTSLGLPPRTFPANYDEQSCTNRSWTDEKSFY